MKIIQIGTNKGSDDLTDIIKNINPQKIETLVFVEPQSFCNESIKICYKDYDFFIENVVITDNPDVSYMDFFTSHPYHRISSLSEEHIKKHTNVTTEISKIQIPCMRINDLFEKYGITKLDILFVDAEGWDSKIIKDIDFEKYEIDQIYYEHMHNDNPKLYQFLNSKGYEVKKCDFKDGLTSLAKKIK